eukprot:746476-Hanusia_phi.AAC.5
MAGYLRLSACPFLLHRYTLSSLPSSAHKRSPSAPARACGGACAEYDHAPAFDSSSRPPSASVLGRATWTVRKEEVQAVLSSMVDAAHDSRLPPTRAAPAGAERLVPRQASCPPLTAKAGFQDLVSSVKFMYPGKVPSGFV